MDQLTKNGKVSRGRLGVGIQDITPELAKSFNVKDARGILVGSVDAGGPADKAGMKVGDIITQVNGTRVDDMNALRNRVAATPPGSEITITVLRDGHEQQLHPKLTELKEEAEASAPEGGSGKETGSGQLGVTVEPRRGGSGVVITEVVPGSPAAEAGLQPEDVILEINHKAVKSGTDLRDGVKSSGSGPTLLLVSHEGKTLFITLQTR